MGCGPATSNIIEPQQHQQKKYNPGQLQRHKNNNPDQFTEAITIVEKKLGEAHLRFAVQSLQNHQLFGTINKKQLGIIAQEMVVARPQKSKGYIFRQGDTGTCFFLIYQGTVDTEIDGKVVRTLKKGDTFGQLALLFRSPRTASIITTSPNCQFLVVKPVAYKKTLKKIRMDEQFKNSEIIEKVPLFSCLTNKQKYALSNTIKIMIFAQGEIIFRSGDDAHTMYIISDGNVAISIDGKKDLSLKSGQIFGEASIQPGMARSGTAKAVTRTICSMISRNDIESTLGSSINNLLFYNSKKWALMRSPIFKHFNPAEINRIIISFSSFQIEDRETIDPHKYKGFIICLQGQINKQPEGTIFNEEHWNDKTFGCDKLVKKGKGHCGFLPFSKATDLFNELANKNKMVRFADKNKAKRNDFSLSHFIYLKKLGQGQFGQVYLVKNVQFGTNFYAIKCLSKQYIKQQELEESVTAEKNILEKIIFPYIVGYVKAFHDKRYIYLVMEYIHGKEMFDVIREVKSMNTEMVRYYFGCLLLSIQYLHTNNIVYRDLKPENSVVDSNGKVFLIDMGTGKELTSQNFFRTFTIIGTPHYMAPQVFEGNGYSFEVDLWSLGCILFEFLCFKLPYSDSEESDPYSVYTSIKKNNLAFPKFLKDERAKKLLLNLLQKDPRKRGEFTFEKIKKCDYFKHFNWTGLLEEEIKGPYIPREFKNNPLESLHKIEGKDFLRHIYRDHKSKAHQIEEWNGTI